MLLFWWRIKVDDMRTGWETQCVTRSHNDLWLVDRYLRRSATVRSGVPSSPVRFYLSGQIFDQPHYHLLIYQTNAADGSTTGWLIDWFYFCLMCVHSNGSVVVTFDLQFSQLISVEEAEKQLEGGLQEVEATGFVIDKKSIQITGDSQLSSVKSQRPNKKHFTSGTNCDSCRETRRDNNCTDDLCTSKWWDTYLCRHGDQTA